MTPMRIAQESTELGRASSLSEVILTATLVEDFNNLVE